jgi:hypothetical protein
MAEQQVFAIDKFLGVNKSETETLLQLGEAADLSNWLITDDQKLAKQYGYIHLNELAEAKVNGIWYGSLNGVSHLLFARGGKVFEHNLETDVDTELGTIVDAYPATFFVTNNTVYIMDGTGLYSWDGETFQVVEGYIPTAFTAAPPTGGGTILEGINYLTGKKKMKFSGDGESTVFQLPELNIDSFDELRVGAAIKTKDVDYTYDLVNGTFTLVDPPITGVNNVEPTWTKEEEGNRERITNCRFYGGQYYARFWLYGNAEFKNTRFCSGVTMAGASDPSYWPMYTDSDVGEYEITGIVTQYDKQLVFTAGDSSGASAWYSTNENFTDPNSGILTTLFPVFPINSKVGNMAPGQVQIILNNPFTIWKGVYQWVSTYVQNEKNAEWMSKRIQRDIDPLDLTKAITWDWDDKGLYILCIDKRLWIYNYRVDAWYILDLPHQPTCFMTVEKQLYFGTETGQIMKFDESLKTYDGQIIDAVWYMGFYNFGVDWLRKFIQRMFVSLKPETRSKVVVTYETDRNNASDPLIAEYSLLDFDDIDFNDFYFNISKNPQPFKFKIRAKKIDYFKIKLQSNFEEYGATVLTITLPTRTGGEVKKRS